MTTDTGRRSIVDRLYGLLRSIPTWVLWIIVVIWSLPSVSLFLNIRRMQRES